MMTTLEEISQDYGAYSAKKSQAHLRVLRLFVEIYDTLVNSPTTGSGITNALLFAASGAGLANSGLVNADRLTMAHQKNRQRMNEETGHLFAVIEHRYKLYLDLLVSLRNTPKDAWPLPPWDVALFMHAHLLSPVTFANDIASSPRFCALAGMVDLPIMKLSDVIKLGLENDLENPQWTERYPDEQLRLLWIPRHRDGTKGGTASVLATFHARNYTFNISPPFGLNLGTAVHRQMGFARKITAMYPHDPVPKALLLDSQQRYAKFMNLIRLNSVQGPVPAIDIDLFWHTHQLSSSNYLPWCNHHIGRPVNHDNTVEGGILTTGLDDTVAAWGSTYFEDYLNPSAGLSFANAAAASSAHVPSILDTTPPPGLTYAQAELWKYDVSCQKKHMRSAHILKYHEEQLRLHEVAVSFMPPPPSPSALSRNGGGFMKKILKAAIGDISRPYSHQENRSSPIAKRDRAKQSIEGRIYTHAEEKREWGRQRWPLLVAARGFGDPRITYGRPSQGTANLDFPVYPATWYDKKPLGYYDYFTGGKDGDGEIEGGGVPMGAGMCAARFEGGNCIAPPAVYNNDAGN